MVLPLGSNDLFYGNNCFFGFLLPFSIVVGVASSLKGEDDVVLLLSELIIVDEIKILVPLKIAIHAEEYTVVTLRANDPNRESWFL